VIEEEALARINELRDWQQLYDEAEDWHERRRMRNKRPPSYTAYGESFQEAAERRLNRWDYQRERGAFAAGEVRRLEQLETERQLARVRAEKIIEEEERTGVAPTGAWAVKREAGLEHSGQGEPNAISESSKVGVRERLRFAAKVGKEALSRDHDKS
jgi:hypothetical protein